MVIFFKAEKLIAIFNDKNFLEKDISSKDFWLRQKTEMKHLYQLSLILFNILPSSSFIERFFSICGHVCSDRRGSMDHELIKIRCLLKSNIQHLSNLTLLD